MDTSHGFIAAQLCVCMDHEMTTLLCFVLVQMYTGKFCNVLDVAVVPASAAQTFVLLLQNLCFTSWGLNNHISLKQS